jgi:flagellar biosynthesis/type III secretory pathway M-ring protein FliF/YscJ
VLYRVYYYMKGCRPAYVLESLSNSSAALHADVVVAISHMQHLSITQAAIPVCILMHCTVLVCAVNQVLRLRREKEQEAAAAQSARQQAAAAQDASSRDAESLRSTKEMLQQARSAVAALQEQVRCLCTHSTYLYHTVPTMY